MNEIDQRYIATLRYRNMLAMCLNNINFAQQKGFSGFNECLTLYTTMKTDILGDTKKEIGKIIEQLQKDKIKVAEDVKWYSENKATYKWSERHKERQRNINFQPYIRLATHKMKTLLIDQIDKQNLLIKTERPIPQGFEDTYR